MIFDDILDYYFNHFFGKTRDRLDEERNTLLQQAILFFSNELNITKGSVYDVKYFDTLDNAEASISYEGNLTYFIKIKKNKFFICQLSTLAHELIHAQQMDRGELQVFPGYIMWKGQRHNNVVITQEKWEDLPWEQDAIKRQHALSVEFLKHLMMKRHPIRNFFINKFGKDTTLTAEFTLHYLFPYLKKNPLEYK